MKINLWTVVFGILLILALAAFPSTNVTASSDNACWGQATKVFAQMYGMGEHASQEATPRLGLANLARALYADGVIAEPTMQALGQFVSSALGLSIEACQ
jgi:hypothetical protein